MCLDQSPGFTIQFVTSPENLAATAIRPSCTCNATTAASARNDPSAFSTRTLPANSSGSRDTNSTSRGVPYSITVCSETVPVGSSMPVIRTGIRTGVASGKNRASRVMHDSERNAAEALLDKISTPCRFASPNPAKDRERHKSAWRGMHGTRQTCRSRKMLNLLDLRRSPRSRGPPESHR
jgi:hypothetical protein